MRPNYKLSNQGVGHCFSEIIQIVNLFSPAGLLVSVPTLPYNIRTQTRHKKLACVLAEFDLRKHCTKLHLAHEPQLSNICIRL